MMTTRVCLGLLWGVLFMGLTGLAQDRPAGEAVGNATPPLVQNAPAVAEILEHVRHTFSQVPDYECVLKTQLTSNGQTHASTYRCYWKAPGQLRLDVLEGENKGSRIARDALGVIRGSKGGLLKLAVVTLAEGDPRTANARGRRFYLAGWDAVIREAMMALEQGWGHRLQGREEYLGQPCWILDLQRVNDPDNPGITAERIWITTAEAEQPWQLVKRMKYERDHPVDVVEWHHVRIAPGLSDELFRLGK